MDTVKLYRPVGLKELELIMLSDWKKFPPRLYWQPIFYPVLNEEYALQIARDWNTKDESSGYCGIVTTFNVVKDHFEKYAIQNVGGAIHNELWVPAEELEEFNDNIVEGIRVRSAYFGERFEMPDNETLATLLIKFKQIARE